MSDLHERLLAEVQRRLDAANAYDGSCAGNHRHCGDECEEYQAIHDTIDAIRRYEADLRRLERHHPRLVALCVPVCGRCHPAEPGTGNGLWPCDEVRDLAASLGVEVTDVV